MPKNLVRFQKCGVFHFITFNCYQRKPLLNSATAYRIFEHELESVRQRYGFVVAGYVLMPEHVHLLLGETRVASLSIAIQVLKQQTSRKLKSPDADRFWQRRYYDFNVHNENKRVEKLQYMHRNPMKRGLVTKPEDWPWSSFLHCATGEVGVVEIELEWTALKREDEKQLGREVRAILPFAKNAKDGAPAM
jgi:putative transposase